MKHTLSLAVFGTALIFAGGIAVISARTTGAAEKKTCCLTNPRYSGRCEVTPGPDETCSDILAYLNNQSSVGKSYCGNTTIRGGWALVDCEEKQAETEGIQGSDGTFVQGGNGEFQ